MIKVSDKFECFLRSTPPGCLEKMRYFYRYMADGQQSNHLVFLNMLGEVMYELLVNGEDT